MKDYNWTDFLPEKPETFHKKIVQTLERLPQNEEKNNMNKKLSWKKIAIISLAATLAMGTTVYAIGKITGVSTHSSSSTDYKNLPDSAEMKKILGSEAKAVEVFSNGYRFKAGNTGTSQAKDAYGNTIKEFKRLMLTYENGKEQLNSFMTPHLEQEAGKGTVLAETFQDVNIYYQTYMNKFVADDNLSEQDKKDEESGKYVFSYGLALENPVHVQLLMWTENGIDYEILAQDSALTMNELLAMAKEVIEK